MSINLTWISKAIHDVLNWIKGAEAKLSKPLSIAEDLLNGLKSFDESATGQLVETIIEATIPASTGLIDAFKLQLPLWLKELNLIKGEFDKSLTEQWEDVLTYLNSIQDPDVKAAQYNTLKALFSKFVAVNTGNPATIQQMLTLGQPTHSDIV